IGAGRIWRLPANERNSLTPQRGPHQVRILAMARIRGDNHAFGWPGLEPRGTHGDKDGIGTAYSAASRIWFTIWNGIVTEVYYPTVDLPQMRDVQLLFPDGQSFFHQETRYLET